MTLYSAPAGVTIAALYVETGGCYFGIEGVDPWDVTRDARNYRGPYPVVAHPPCERWGKFWFGGTSPRQRRRELGDDDGCFLSAFMRVRAWGGVLEHPAGSKAWDTFKLSKPPRAGGWVSVEAHGGFTCCVEQGHYGHGARKATWLYADRVDLPELIWGPSAPARSLPQPQLLPLSPAERRSIQRNGNLNRLPRRERAATPPAFRDLLLSIARSAYPDSTNGRSMTTAPAFLGDGE